MHKADYITPSNRVTRDLQLYVGSEPQGRSCTVHIPEVLSSIEPKVSMCADKPAYRHHWASDSETSEGRPTGPRLF
jgi:hypothetical protein